METTTLQGLGFRAVGIRPLINKPSPLNCDYNGDPNIEALERMGLID